MNSLKKDISSALSKLRASFHMPGHKYKSEVLRALYEELISLDCTEIHGTDNLHDAKHCIKNAEKRCSQIYGSGETRFLVGGSTAGILAAIYGMSEENQKVLIGRDSHKSVFNACSLRHLRPTYALPTLNAAGIPTGYSDALEKIKADSEIKLAILTSPNYYGYVSDLSEVSLELKKRGGFLIVDEAHGAHLEFFGLRDLSALNQGADIVLQSAHKTLPALTMSAMLHYGKDFSQAALRADKIEFKKRASVEQALRLFQSSSPSYPLMISIDEATSYMDSNRELCKNKREDFIKFRNEISNDLNVLLDGLPAPEDPSKLFLNSLSMGIKGNELDYELRKRGIYAEFAQTNGILIYLSASNDSSDLNALKSALLEIADSIDKKDRLSSAKLDYGSYFQSSYTTKMSAETLQNQQTCKCKIASAAGKIAAEDIIPYPPGIPAVLKGELLSKEICCALSEILNEILVVCQ